MGEVVSRGGVSKLSSMQGSHDTAIASVGEGEEGDQARLMMVAVSIFHHLT